MVWPLKRINRADDRMICQKRALAERLAQKRLLASVHTAKSVQKSLKRSLAEKERQRIQAHKREAEERLKNGLAGQRLGRHLVPECEVDVQLGEDLTESVRGLKVSLDEPFMTII